MKIITATLALLLLLEASIRPAHATPAAEPVDVLVAFEGVIVHVLGGGVTRAIVPRLGHRVNGIVIFAQTLGSSPSIRRATLHTANPGPPRLLAYHRSASESAHPGVHRGANEE